MPIISSAKILNMRGFKSGLEKACEIVEESKDNELMLSQIREEIKKVARALSKLDKSYTEETIEEYSRL